MHEFLLMQVIDRPRHRGHQRRGRAWCEWFFRQLLLQRAADDQFHRNERDSCHVTHFVDLHEIRVIDRRLQAGFLLKSTDLTRRKGLGAKDFHRHTAIQSLIKTLVNIPRATATQVLDDSKVTTKISRLRYGRRVLPSQRDFGRILFEIGM
jgi:hypothetical protein